MNSYFDFAEDDYRFFLESYDAGIVRNGMAALASEACEKFLKHLINEYDYPRTEDEIKAHGSVLRSHSIVYVAGYVENTMGAYIMADEWRAITAVNGYYMGLRYPGRNKISPVTRDDLDVCKKAVETCRSFTLRAAIVFGENEPLPEDIEH